jgi:hypothetical protein
MAERPPAPAASVVATAVRLTMAAVSGPVMDAALPGLKPYLQGSGSEKTAYTLTRYSPLVAPATPCAEECTTTTQAKLAPTTLL